MLAFLRLKVGYIWCYLLVSTHSNKNPYELNNLASWSDNAQTNSKTEVITINSPCELVYRRNISNQNNYSSPFQCGNGKLVNYSVTVSKPQAEMIRLTGNSLNKFKKNLFENNQIQFRKQRRNSRIYEI
ncbi:MAG: hypothetical protein CVT98_06325 [Bacteroidetes bacterium HGW-Bacteroidetes-15]|nr:MAG: hypothetical protein CVT98_06325 [Bacteroidetes bacterium HGW-Bacteroidetes-15]